MVARAQHRLRCQRHHAPPTSLPRPVRSCGVGGRRLDTSGAVAWCCAGEIPSRAPRNPKAELCVVNLASWRDRLGGTVATAAESEVAYRAWLHMAKQHAFGKTGSSLRRKGGEGRRRRPEAGAGPSRARLARHVCQSLPRIVGNEAADAFAERSLPSNPLAVLRQLEAKRSAKLAGARVGGSYVLPAPAGQPMSSQDVAPYKPGLALPPLSPLRWPGALPVAIARPLAWAAPVGAKCTSNACLRQALTMGQIGGARVQVAPLRAHARPERVIAYSSALLKRPPCSDLRQIGSGTRATRVSC